MLDISDAVSRRTFGAVLAAGALAWPRGADAAAPVTAAQLIERIRIQCAAEGVTWTAQTVDAVKAGDPATPVTGVACTFMSTLPVLREAAKVGANLVVTHEPIFWSHEDDVAPWRGDPIFEAKRRFIESHGLVVFRFHDHWHQIAPEPMSIATRRQLGWDAYLDPASGGGFEARYIRAPLPLRALAAELRDRLPSRSIRVIGDPVLSVSRIGFCGHGLDSVVAGLRTLDVVIAPEAREYDSVEYVRDLLAAGEARALILIAHERGEAAGMARCAEWMTSYLAPVPVRYFDSGEPFVLSS